MKSTALRNAIRAVVARVRAAAAPAASAVATLALAACGPSHVLIGSAHSPVSPDQVRIYLEPISRKYEEIAVVDASSRGSFSFRYEAKADVVINRLKEEAGKLGANGILLQEITDAADGAVGAGVGAILPGDHGTIGIGVNGVGLFSPRFGRAIAVYVEPE